MKLTTKLLSSLLLLAILSTPSFADFEFISKINCGSATCSGTEDYGDLQTWNNGVDDGAAAVYANTAKCGLWDGQSGSNIADATSVTWDGGSSTGTLIHMTNHAGTSEDMYFIAVTGGTLADNDTISDGTNTFDIAGTPDACDVVAEVYSDDGDLTQAAGVSLNLTGGGGRQFIIRSATADRHNGTKNSGARIVLNGTAGIYFSINTSGILVSWMEIYLSSTSANQYAFLNENNSGVNDPIIMDHNIVYGNTANTTGTVSGVLFNDNFGRNNNIYSNVFFDLRTYGIFAFGRFRTTNVFNNTVYGCGTGIYCWNDSGSDVLLKNNISVGNTTDYGGTCSANSTHNLASDTTAPEFNTYWDSKTISFVDATNRNLHLASGETDAIDAGTDLGNDTGTGKFDVDIDGRDRDTEADTWDLGADEFVASGATTSDHTHIFNGVSFFNGVAIF